MTSDKLPEWLQRQGAFIINGKIYARCDGCGGIIRVNKPVFGALHLCNP